MLSGKGDEPVIKYGMSEKSRDSYKVDSILLCLFINVGFDGSFCLFINVGFDRSFYIIICQRGEFIRYKP